MRLLGLPYLRKGRSPRRDMELAQQAVGRGVKAPQELVVPTRAYNWGMRPLCPKQTGDFARWLALNPRTSEVWLVFYKKTSGKQTVGYRHCLQDAVCHGWVDSRVKSIDARGSWCGSHGASRWSLEQAESQTRPGTAPKQKNNRSRNSCASPPVTKGGKQRFPIVHEDTTRPIRSLCLSAARKCTIVRRRTNLTRGDSRKSAGAQSCQRARLILERVRAVASSLTLTGSQVTA